MVTVEAEDQRTRPDFQTPRPWLPSYALPHEVVSCEAAAEAKGVPLERELKTLVIRVSDKPTWEGFVLAHVRGDRRLALRSVKRALNVKQARLASRESLEELGLEPGTVEPFSAALWGLKHLIASEVLSLGWVTTNAGQLDRYVVFDPLVLLRASHKVVEDLEA